MNQEVQTTVEAPVKRIGRPKGSKNKATTVEAPVAAIAPKKAKVIEVPQPVVETPLVVSSITDLASFIDQWKKEANLSTLQLLKLYKR